MNKFPGFVGRSIVEHVGLPEKPSPPKVGTPPVKMVGQTLCQKVNAAGPSNQKSKPATASLTIRKPEKQRTETESDEIVVFFGTLSLSRALVFNAMVRSFADSKGKVFVVSAKQWSDTLKWMWADRPNIQVFGVGSLEAAQKMHRTLSESGKTVLSVNHSGISWDKLDYEVSGVPFEDRWAKFVIGGQVQMIPPPIPEPQSTRYALVHDDAERGWHIRKELLPRGPIKIVRMDKSHPNLFAWRALIEGAYEIHCVPSAVSVLVDSIPTKANHLVLHNYARPGKVAATYKKQWGVIA